MHFQLLGGSGNKDNESFTIDSETGEVFTKEVFDRERKRVYTLGVEAADGAPSDIPNRGGRPNFGTNI